MRSSRPTCRLCGAEVLWITMQESGKRNPVEPTPSSRGTILLAGNRGVVVPLKDRDRVLISRRKLYISHIATCPGPQVRPRNPRVAAHLARVMEALGNPDVELPSATTPEPRRPASPIQHELFGRKS